MSKKIERLPKHGYYGEPGILRPNLEDIAKKTNELVEAFNKLNKERGGGVR